MYPRQLPAVPRKQTVRRDLVLKTTLAVKVVGAIIGAVVVTGGGIAIAAESSLRSAPPLASGESASHDQDGTGTHGADDEGATCTTATPSHRPDVDPTHPELTGTHSGMPRPEPSVSFSHRPDDSWGSASPHPSSRPEDGMPSAHPGVSSKPEDADDQGTQGDDQDSDCQGNQNGRDDDPSAHPTPARSGGSDQEGDHSGFPSGHPSGWPTSWPSMSRSPIGHD
jgi:hypothetical protein